MKNLWEVIHALVNDSSLPPAEKSQAHALIDAHLAQHLGIARTQGEHRERLRALEAGVTPQQSS
jgi:hypothetical protein